MESLEQEVIHQDILGQPLSIGSYVAVSRRNRLQICQVIKVSPKMIRVKPIKGNYREGYLVYSTETVILSGPDALAYILSNAGK